MVNYKTFLILPIFKNNKFSQNDIFNQKNFISRSSETRSLVSALDASIVFEKIINISIPKSSLLINNNVANEIKNNFDLSLVDLIIFDCSLSPIQQRNLERILQKKIIDRTQLIIEIFGLRAKTKEGKLQVELANLSFEKTRLVRSWTHLERQRGGLSKIGGPGESQIELDKRMINSKIKQLKKSLTKVTQTREVQRKLRKNVSSLIFSLVGYTNSGKSTIFNSLTSSDILVKDMVFATLDTKMGSIKISNNKKIIISDTVGFISALPTELIDSFKSSLEELFIADYLLLVHDLSNPNIENQAKLVFDTLISIGFTEEELEKKIINVFNKCDLNSDLSNIKIKYKKNLIKTSALTPKGMKDLKNYIENLAEKKFTKVLFHIPIDSHKISSWLYKNSYVFNETYCDIDFVGNKVKAKISNDKLNSFKSHFPEIKLYTIQ